eukprot:TRINITY_DN9628_c0_g1_i3.p2 TRINITY_DN9628_c0_g1~~TRINITY_DN9628_c0_g1_i3.p2  ORF type:complete len:263 (-),score=68.39 TRINITY_DN9628_c0_g1_i3:1328-2116(-)
MLRSLVGSEMCIRDRCTMCALDGAMIAAIPDQLGNAPVDGNYFIISVGGNNATGAVSTVLGEATTVEESILRLHTFVAAFEQEFTQMVQRVVQVIGQKPLVLCGCYNPCFHSMNVTTVSQGVVNTAMALLADVVQRVGTRFGAAVIDWRRVMTKVEDFANPIEPSSVGGAKMADCIVNVVRSHPFDRRVTVVYPTCYPESQMVVDAMPTDKELAFQGGLLDSHVPSQDLDSQASAKSVLDDPDSAAMATTLRGAQGEEPGSD